MTRAHKQASAALAAALATAWLALSVPGTAVAATTTGLPHQTELGAVPQGGSIAPVTATPALAASDHLTSNVTYAANPDATAAAAAQPAFNFCNTTGGKIACFRSQITFTSSSSFVLTDIALSDTICDNRAVFATVYLGDGAWRAGTINGVPYTFENPHGCKTTRVWARMSFTKPSSRIGSVHIKLFAANITSHSTIVSSKKRTNPLA
jgi:hypothetical protein